MSIRHPESYKIAAEEIAKSWSVGGGSNFVLVAPPLTDPEYVFKLLHKVSFHEECDLDSEKLAVAYLSQVSYRTSEEFVRRVIDMWKVDLPDSDEYIDELDKLEDAIELLEEKDRVPIILLPQFHKAVEKLSWSLGSRLREMEINYGLCTVVELPVPLSRLRERWELRPDKETFICSDFGQGHSMILLAGYKNQEVQALAHKSGVPEEYLEDILSWSGGMPALVHWLILEAKLSKSLNAFQATARKGSVEQCRRFLGWLDAPTADYYKKRISAIWLGIASEEQRTEVKGHDWKDVLIDRNGEIFSSAIGYACTNSVGGDYANSINAITKAVTDNKPIEVDALVNSLSEAFRTQEVIKYLLVVVPVWRLAMGFSPDWVEIEKVSIKAINKLGNDKSDTAAKVKTVLRKWHNFAKCINNFNRLTERNKEEGWRLTDSLSGRGKGKKDSPLAAVQLVHYRLYQAEKLQDSNTALKSVLEIPEQILQIYCGRKLQIPVWEAPKFESNIIVAVRSLWVEGEFKAPKEKSRLGFNYLLYFGWVYMSGLDKNERLFDEISDIQYWRETYDDIRNQPSHSITFETNKNWNDFHSKCIDLADKLAITLTGKGGQEALPKLEELIATLAGNNKH